MDNNITIHIIDKEHSADINIPNQPFSLFGRLLPSYIDGEWNYQALHFEDAEVRQMCFPDENYNFDELSKNSVIFGAYNEKECIGIAILQHSWNKYMYLYDLKVNQRYRGKHIGSHLIEEAKKVSMKHGYHGLYTKGQDNNLGACLFYLKSGFTIGGIDTHVYKGTRQEGKSDIIFYTNSQI